MKWSMLLLVFQLLSFCHSHPIFAQVSTKKSIVCNFNANLDADPLLSLYNGSDSWSGKGDLICLTVAGENHSMDANVCLSSWLGNESLFTKAPKLTLASRPIYINQTWDIIGSMEVLTLASENDSHHIMTAWPMIDDYPFLLTTPIDEFVANGLKNATLTIDADVDSSTSCSKRFY